MLSATQATTHSKAKSLFVYTDVARDVDDAMGLTLLKSLVQKGQCELTGLVANSMISHVRARVARAMHQIYGEFVPVAEGSAYPLGKNDEPELLNAYLQTHILQGGSYEGEGLQGLNRKNMQRFRDPTELLFDILQQAEFYKKKVDILCRSPLTDLAKALLDNEGLLKRNVGSIIIQGDAIIGERALEPNPAAYNLKEDMMAAEIAFKYLQEHIPFVIVSKHAAYQCPLTLKDFEGFKQQGILGEYLYQHAINGLLCFYDRLPDLCSTLYANGLKVPRTQFIQRATHLSNPYDPISLLAHTHPQFFTPQIVQYALTKPKHKIIGSSKDQTGVLNPTGLKQLLLQEIHNGLKLHNK